MAKIFQNRGGTLTQILNTDDYVNIGNVTQSIAGTKTFSGTVNVPNVAAGDSSTKAANTKFVHDELTKFLTCYEETYTASSSVSSGTTITIPNGVKYIRGSNMLQVFYNGLVEYNGEQFEETGTVGQESTTIKILHNMESGDELLFRINGLCDVDSVSDAVHIAGSETVTGTKTFSASPLVPNVATTDKSTKSANTKFVHDMVDGFMMCYDEVLTVATPVVSGGNITLPAGMQYVVGSHMLMMSYNGTVCHIGEQFNEVGTTGQNSSTIQVLFDLRVGDKLGFRLHGISEAVQIPYDVVHTSGSETISGVKSFNSSPVVPTPSLGDYSNSVVTSKWVKDLSNTPVYVDSVNGSDSNSGMTAAESVKTIGKAIEILNSMPTSTGIKQRIIIAGGSYTEDVWLSNINLEIQLNGTVTINGQLTIVYNSLVSITGNSETTLNINCESKHGLCVWDLSEAEIHCPIQITASDTNSKGIVPIWANNNSVLYFYESVTIICTSISIAVQANEFCFINFKGGLSTNGSITVHSILSRNTSRVLLYGSGTIYNSLTARYFSEITFASGGGTYNLYRVGGGYVLGSEFYSYINLSSTKINMYLGDSTSGYCISVSDYGYVDIRVPSLVMSGKCNMVTRASYYSTITIVPTLDFTGSNVTNGKRYDVNRSSSIYTFGGGANRIPGTTAGAVESNASCYYY